MSDETKNVAQDTHPEGQAPSDTTGTTPGGEPETYTKAQLDEAIQRARIQAGRDAKTLENRSKDLEKREKDLKARETAEAERQRRIDEEQEAELKDKPEALDLFRERKRIKKERAELEADKRAHETEKAEHAEELQLAQETKSDVVIWRIAQEIQVDPVQLKESAKELGLISDEQITNLAKRLPKAEGDNAPHKVLIDSSKGRGGTNINDMSPEEKINWALKNQK